jgi:hypothetical protein
MSELLLDAKIVAIAHALERAKLPYAFGGAIALAYYAAPRGTEDIDLNAFIPVERAEALLAPLRALGVDAAATDPEPPTHQRTLRWDHTPIHVFFSYDALHERCRERAREVPFADDTIRILGAEDIVIFKVVYDRPKDRAEVREVLLCLGERFDAAYAIAWLERILGRDDARVARFRAALAELAGAQRAG